MPRQVQQCIEPASTLDSSTSSANERQRRAQHSAVRRDASQRCHRTGINLQTHPYLDQLNAAQINVDTGNINGSTRKSRSDKASEKH